MTMQQTVKRRTDLPPVVALEQAQRELNRAKANEDRKAVKRLEPIVQALEAEARAEGLL